MGFHSEGVGKDTSAELNRDRKLARVRAATAHAALVFRVADCADWCQFGQPGGSSSPSPGRTARHR